jgi:hypothetical protein
MNATIKTYQYLIESGGLIINVSNGTTVINVLNNLKKFKTPLEEIFKLYE